MSIKLWLGPMCSGKTTHLAADLNRLSSLGYPVLYLNSILDTRQEGSNISTNSPIKINLNCSSKKVKKLLDVDVNEFFAVGIDEGQFFSDLPEAVTLWRDLGKEIYIAGLDGDSNQKPFGRILETVPLCDAGKLFKLEAICIYCKEEKKHINASYTKKKQVNMVPNSKTSKISKRKRTKNNPIKKVVKFDEDKKETNIDIGGTDKYVPVCWKHLK